MRRASRSTAIRPPRAASTARHTSKPCRIACSHSPVVHCRTSRWDVMSLIVRKKLEIESGDAFEHAMAPGIVEGERRHALFDHGRAPAVLNLVEQRPALALSAEQGARDRRPAQHGGVGEVEDIVEAIAVGIIGVVGQLSRQTARRRSGPADPLAIPSPSTSMSSTSNRRGRRSPSGSAASKRQRLGALASPSAP